MNIINHNNYFILTGGPGSGKSSIISVLKNMGYICVDEAARQIIQEQANIGGDALHNKDQIKFRDLMLSRSIADYHSVSESECLVFFDRGIPELISYCHLIQCEVPEAISQATKLYRYNHRVFIAPPWKEIYRHDMERKQDWDEAVATHQHIAAAYVEAGYELIELPKTSVNERVEFILHQSSQTL